MDTRPEPPPEGRLIDDARDRAGISVREAARRAGISNTRWNQIVKGSHAPARTIARMALAAGVTPAQLAVQGGRPDAAEVLAGILSEDDPTLPGIPAAAPSAADEMVLRISEAIIGATREIAEGIRREIAGRRAEGYPEDRIFDDPGEQAMWAIPLMSEHDRILRIVALRAMPPRGNSGEPPVELAG